MRLQRINSEKHFEYVFEGSKEKKKKTTHGFRYYPTIKSECFLNTEDATLVVRAKSQKEADKTVHKILQIIKKGGVKVA